MFEETTAEVFWESTKQRRLSLLKIPVQREEWGRELHVH